MLLLLACNLHVGIVLICANGKTLGRNIQFSHIYDIYIGSEFLTSHGRLLEKGRRSEQRSVSTVLLKMPAGHSCSIVCSSSFPIWWTACVETVRHRSEPYIDLSFSFVLFCNELAGSIPGCGISAENHYSPQKKSLSASLTPPKRPVLELAP